MTPTLTSTAPGERTCPQTEVSSATSRVQQILDLLSPFQVTIPGQPDAGTVQESTSTPVARLPDLAAWVQPVLDVLSEKEGQVLLRRWGWREVIGETAQALRVTREHVRITELRALRRLDPAAEDLQRMAQRSGPGVPGETSWTLLRFVPDSAAAARAFQEAWNAPRPEAPRRRQEMSRFPHPLPETAFTQGFWWSFCEALLNGSAHRHGRFRTRTLETGHPDARLWITIPQAEELAALPNRLLQHGRFIRQEHDLPVRGHPGYTHRTTQLPDLQDAGAALLAHGVTATAGGHFAHSGWTARQWGEAVAEQLALNGVNEWHLNEMAAALAFVYPHRFAGLTPVGVSGIVGPTGLKPGMPRSFRQGQERGYWTLNRLPA